MKNNGGRRTATFQLTATQAAGRWLLPRTVNFNEWRE
jgi:hypothetical protein